MICKQCNHNLPEDSEFCQYCGVKLERANIQEERDECINNDPQDESVEITDLLEPNRIESMSSDEILEVFIKEQAKNTVNAWEANSKTQPENEDDVEFGLVPEKPIYTLAHEMVDGELEYLNKLRTSNGEKIQYNRKGSRAVKGVNGIVDIYDIFLPTGEFYKTIYINMHGAKKTTKAPAGFVFANPIITQSSRSGENEEVKDKRTGKLSNKLLLLTNGMSFVLTVVAIFSIIAAMNVQDANRDIFESTSPTAVYIVILLTLGVFAGFAIHALFKGKFKLLFLLAILSVIVGIIATEDYSIFSSYYYNRMNRIQYYINSDLVDVLNSIWVFCVQSTLVITFIPIVVSAVKAITGHCKKVTKSVGKLKFDEVIISIIGCIGALSLAIDAFVWEDTEDGLTWLLILFFYVMSSVLFYINKKRKNIIMHIVLTCIMLFFVICEIVIGVEEWGYAISDEAMIFFLILLLSTIALFVLSVISLFKAEWNLEFYYSSIRYREKCYKRVAKMKEYLDNGIITEVEYEKNKKEILKNIKM